MDVEQGSENRESIRGLGGFPDFNEYVVALIFFSIGYNNAH